jgi:hypothetical protein
MVVDIGIHSLFIIHFIDFGINCLLFLQPPNEAFLVIHNQDVCHSEEANPAVPLRPLRFPLRPLRDEFHAKAPRSRNERNGC